MGARPAVSRSDGTEASTPLDPLARARPDLAMALRNTVRDTHGCVCILHLRGAPTPSAKGVARVVDGLCQEVRDVRSGPGERVLALRCDGSAPGACALRSGERVADQRGDPALLPPAAQQAGAVPAARAAVGLGPRELETARLAIAMGYYRSPRRCTMEDIARELGITKSAVYHRMSKVEQRALEALLAGDPPDR